MKAALMNQNTLPIIGSGPLASAPVASAENLGLCYLETGDTLWPNGRVWQYSRRNKVNKYTSTFKGKANGFDATWTTALRIPCVSGPAKIKIQITNDTGSAVSASAYCAVSNTDNSSLPSVGTGITGNPNTGWASLKKNGSTDIVIPAFSSVWTDKIDLVMIDPLVDGGCIVIINIPSMLNIRYTYDVQGHADLYNGWRSFSGGSLTTNGAENADVLTLLGYEIEDSIQRQSAFAVGDSLTEGWPFSGWFGYERQSDFSEINAGVPGENTAQFLTHLQDDIILLKPSVVFYSPYSPNDGTIDATIASAQKNRFLQAFNICRENAVQIIPTVLCPNENIDATQDGFRIDVLNYANAICKSEMSLISSVAKGTIPDRFIDSLKYDSLHPNDDGYIAMRSLFSANVSSVYGTDFWLRPIQ